ncbi:MAG TPA: hypothetical protein VMT15_03835 [Bryobacteraceae bacterium]|nr:hypothetical protein [Bryobacteraceae bacterium]
MQVRVRSRLLYQIWGEDRLNWPEGRHPSSASLTASILLHIVALLGVAMISLTAPSAGKPEQAYSRLPTEIRIADHLYYVADISEQLQPRQKVERRPVAKRQERIASSERDTPVPAATAAARALVPPELRARETSSEQTLIQPLSPPDLLPPNVQLPSLKIWTTELPKIPKAVVEPGRKTYAPPQTATLTPPDFNLVHAEPVPSNSTPRLVLPPLPPPVIDVQPPKISTAVPVPAIPMGDPVNVLSLNNNPIPLKERLVVPPGNVIGKSGETLGSTGLLSEDSDRTKQAAGTERKSAPAAARKAGDAAEAANAAASLDKASKLSSGTNVAPAVPGSMENPTAARESAAGGGPIDPRSGSSSSPASAGSGNSSVAPMAEGPDPARPIVRSAPNPRVILRPLDGTFDAVIVQSSPLSQFPEAKELLTGRPIYTVYVSLGTAKDWALYYCIPSDRSRKETEASVVQVGATAPVQAPYPTRLVRPEVTVPSYQKYILVHGSISALGRFEGLKIVRSAQPDADQALVSSLTGWEFRAATVDGVKVGVEFLLSIPVRGL